MKTWIRIIALAATTAFRLVQKFEPRRAYFAKRNVMLESLSFCIASIICLSSCDQLRQAVRVTSFDIAGNYNAKIEDCTWITSNASNISCSMVFQSLQKTENAQSWSTGSFSLLLDDGKKYEPDNLTILDYPLDISQSYTFQPGIPVKAKVNFTIPVSTKEIRKLSIGNGTENYFDYIPVSGTPTIFNVVPNGVPTGIYSVTVSVNSYKWKLKHRDCQKASVDPKKIACTLEVANIRPDSRDNWQSEWFSIVTPDGKKFSASNISFNGGPEGSSVSGNLTPNGQISLKINFNVASDSVKTIPFLYFQTCGLIACSGQYQLKDLPVN
jgi:hypothetical protein